MHSLQKPNEPTQYVKRDVTPDNNEHSQLRLINVIKSCKIKSRHLTPVTRTPHEGSGMCPYVTGPFNGKDLLDCNTIPFLQH